MSGRLGAKYRRVTIPERLSRKFAFVGGVCHEALDSTPPARWHCTPLPGGPLAKPIAPWARRTGKSRVAAEGSPDSARTCENVSPGRLQWKGTSSFVILIIKLGGDVYQRTLGTSRSSFLLSYRIPCSPCCWTPSTTSATPSACPRTTRPLAPEGSTDSPSPGPSVRSRSYPGSWTTSI